MKALSKKLRSGPSEMYPFLFPAPLNHRSDPTVRLYFLCAAITPSQRAERRQQTRRQRRTRSWQRVKDEKVRMRFCCFLNLPVQLRNALDQNSDQLRDHFHYLTFGLNHRPIPNGRNRFADPDNAALDDLLVSTVVLAEKHPQPRGGNFLPFLQRRPALQQRISRFPVQPIKPIQYLRKVDLQVARQSIDLLCLLVYQFAPFLYQILHAAGSFRIWG